MRYSMIMAGGAGTRLWPMSRQARPKQLIPFIGGRSLLEIAADRIDGLVPPERQLICTGEAFRGLITSALPRFSDEQILGEPEGRDTVNAIGLTAAVLAKREPEAIFAVLTADHIIEPVDRFRATMDTGFRLVEEDPQRLVTFSIEPTRNATEYGYVEREQPIEGFDDAFVVSRFKEKPKTEVEAKALIDTGRCAWNSGMFVFSALGFLRAVDRFWSGSTEGLARIADAWDTRRRSAVLREVYPALPAKSVDFAIMEPASTDDEFEVATVRLALDRWLDVGSWPSFGDTLPPDEQGNRTNARAVHLDSRGVLAVSADADHTIVTIGCENLIVVHTADATLVCPASEAQRVKEAVQAVPQELR